MVIRICQLLFRRFAFVIAFLVWFTKGIAQEDPLIFPVPQQIHLDNSYFSLDASVPHCNTHVSRSKALGLAKLLVKELSDRYGLALHITYSNTIPVDTRSIILGTLNNPLIKAYCNKNHLQLSAKNPGKEGYVLHINPHSIVVAGSDDAGAFYGFQSLRQLIEKGKGKASGTLN